MNGLLATKKQKTSGFSLIELAVVLIIMGIVLYGTLSVGTAQLEMARIRLTADKLQKIQNAITVFYKVNGYLPCPASGSALISDSSFGAGSRTDGGSGTTNSTCTATDVIVDAGGMIYAGVVPIKELSLSNYYAFGAWGNRISYIVSKNCIDQDNWVATNTYGCSDGATTTANGGKLQMTGQNTTSWSTLAAYIIISHGTDSIGAWRRVGGPKVEGDKPNTDTEKNNGNLDVNGVALATGSAVTVYYDKAINDGGGPEGGGGSGNYFDDIVRWKTAQQIYYDATH